MITFSLLIKTELLLCAVCLNDLECNVVKSELYFTKKHASKNCKDKGNRLVDYLNILSGSSGPKIASVLANGESVWIDGYAKFSSVLDEQGCFYTPKYPSYLISHAYVLDTPNLYLCVRKCIYGNTNVRNIGMQQTNCICFDDDENIPRLLGVVNSSLCDVPCSNLGIGICGSLQYMSLYRIVKDLDIAWADHQPAPRQCVNVQSTSTSAVPRYTTKADSCFTSDKVGGYICSNSFFSELNTDKCSNKNLTSNYCLVKNKTTRQDAFYKCLKENGTLAGHFGEQNGLHLMNDDGRYWTSAFRTFKLTHRKNSNDMGCVAVTKVSDRLYLEPDNCTAKKPYFYIQIKTPTTVVTETEHSDKISTSDKYSVASDVNFSSRLSFPVTSSPNASLISGYTLYVQTTNANLKTFKTDCASSKGQNTTVNLRTASVKPIKVTGLDTNGVSILAYILPSSLLLISAIGVAVGYVIYMRTVNYQRDLQSHFHRNTAAGPELISGTDHNIMTVSMESSLLNVHQNMDSPTVQTIQYLELQSWDISPGQYESHTCMREVAGLPIEQSSQYNEIECRSIHEAKCESSLPNTYITIGRPVTKSDQYEELHVQSTSVQVQEYAFLDLNRHNYEGEPFDQQNQYDELQYRDIQDVQYEPVLSHTNKTVERSSDHPNQYK